MNHWQFAPQIAFTKKRRWAYPNFIAVVEGSIDNATHLRMVKEAVVFQLFELVGEV